MLFLSWLRSLRSKVEGTRARNTQREKWRRRAAVRRLILEQLEQRIQPSTVNWVNPSGGDWDTPSNWSTGQLPGPGDDVVINQTGITITHATSASDSVNSLTSQATLVLSAGSLSIAASSTMSAFNQSGGTLTGAGTVTVSGLLTWTGGIESGTGTTVANGGLAITASNAAFTVLDGRTLTNAATATVNGSGNQYLDLGDNAVLNNLPGATFDFEAEVSLRTNGEVSGAATFNNQGILEKSADTGSDTTNFDAVLDNSGTVQVLSGTLSLQGDSTDTGSFTVSGGATLGFDSGAATLGSGSIISGAGTVEIGGGTVNVNAGSTYNVSGLTTINSGTVNFNSGNNITTGTLTQSGGTLTGSDTVTVSGLLTWTGGTESGTGTTVANGGLAITASNAAFTILDGRTLTNAVTATVNGIGNQYLDIGDNAVLNNLPGATFDFQADVTLRTNYEVSGAGTFNNQGTLEKSADTTSDTTNFEAILNNSGTVQVLSGTLSLQGGSTEMGSLTVSAGGTLGFDSGTYTLGNGNNISGTGTVEIGGGTVNVNAGSTYNVSGLTNIHSGTVNFSSGTDPTTGTRLSRGAH